MSALTITESNFESEVLNSDKPVLLDFWASWCGPCRAFGPVVEDYASKHPEIKVGKVNVDEERGLAGAFSVMSIPTAVVIKDGKLVNRVSGAMNESQLHAFVNA